MNAWRAFSSHWYAHVRLLLCPGAAEAVGQLEQRFATLWGSVLGNNLPADWVKVAVPEDASSLPHTTMTQVIAAQLLKCLDACAQQISALQRKVDQAPDPSILAKKDYQLAALVDGMRSLHQHQITLVFHPRKPDQDMAVVNICSTLGRNDIGRDFVRVGDIITCQFRCDNITHIKAIIGRCIIITCLKIPSLTGLIILFPQLWGL